MEKFSKEILKFLSNRIVILIIFIFCLMVILMIQLFDLQIIKGKQYLDSFEKKIQRTLPIEAPRGTIYDRNGVPLAINKTVYSVKIDPSISVYNQNEVLFNLVNLFKENKQDYNDPLPITLAKPYEYTFDDNLTAENQWKKDMGFVDKDGKPLDISAEDAMKKMGSKSYFNVDSKYSDEDSRKIIGLRSALFLKRFSGYVPITIALDVDPKVTVAIEEDSEKYTGIYVDLDSKREYPYGKYVSALLGYTGAISDDDLTKLNAAGGVQYTINDTVGKFGGIEESMEKYLKGSNGSMNVEVNSIGKRVNTEKVQAPIPGDKVYLTIDINLQMSAYDALKDQLTQVLIKKIQGTVPKEKIQTDDAIISMQKANNIPVKDIWAQPDGTKSAEVKNKVLAKDPTLNVDDVDNRKKVNNAISDSIKKGDISVSDMFLVMNEIGVITLDDKTKKSLNLRKENTTNLLVEKLKDGEITPQTLNLQPCTGSVVVVDVNTGSVLAAAGYPSFDNNEFVNNFNDEYFYKVNRDDPTKPLLDRPFMEARAPGSTFKMLTAITCLEAGAIQPNTKIIDQTVFKKAGYPPLRCWSPVSHGSINVSEALEVSCNYFFCEASYRLGNAVDGNTRDAIDKLDQYLSAFGFGERTGVEVTEMADLAPKQVPIYASPEFKEYSQKLWNKNITDTETAWRDGDTIQTAIGQSVNNYTTASMAKYTMVLANGGTRYQFHLMDKINDSNGNLVDQFNPVVEQNVNASPSTWKAVYDGMVLVTTGPNGTGAAVFKGLPITVAGKTGTAQEVIDNNNSAHSSFAGFAPYQNPEMAIYTMIPNGDTLTMKAPASRVSRAVIESYYDFGDNYSPLPNENINNFTNN